MNIGNMLKTRRHENRLLNKDGKFETFEALNIHGHGFEICALNVVYEQTSGLIRCL